MTGPGRTTLIVAGGLVFAMLGAAVNPWFFWLALSGDVMLVFICLIQGRRLGRLPVTVEREGWAKLEIDRETDLVYRIQNLSHRHVIVSIRPAWPASFDVHPKQIKVGAGPSQVVRVAVAVTARRRGRVSIPPAQIDLRFPSDWAHHRRTQDDEAVVTVYPALRAMAQYDMLRRHHALGQFGIHRTRMVGSGREFDQLREYLPDDNYGDINWKATARRRELVTNVYRAERSQDVILCLDCGRMMGNPIGNGTALDQAVSAATMLTHVCTRWGDRVGLVLFRDTVTRYIKPVGPGRGCHAIIQQLVHAEPEGVFPSYRELVSALRAGQKRRSMIFVFTDLNDPQLASNLTDVLPLLSRRHVVVVVNLRDPILERVASGPAADSPGVCQVLAARHLANERSTRVRELVKAGVQVMEVDADSITVDAINTYMAIKMRQLV